MADNLVVTTGAAEQVGVELDTYQASAWNAIDEARTALDKLAEAVPNFPEAAARPGTASGSVSYTEPTGKPSWTYIFNAPSWSVGKPVLDPVAKVDIDDFTGDPPAAPNINIPVQPNPIMPTDPGAAPGASLITIPDAPVLEDITDPKEWAITIPTIPTIDIPPFSSTKPNSSITKPSGTMNWQEDPYTSELLTETVDQVSEYFKGGLGLPQTTWEYIWAKENDRENRNAVKLISEVDQHWSDRGFDMPQGPHDDQINQIYQDINNSSNQRSREIAIRESDLEIENLRFAVQQGIALEGLRGSWYQATMGRLLDSSKFTAELGISVFNAEVSFYNAQLQAYLADVQVYEAQIRAELSKLEAAKLELEAQQLIGDLNLQQVQIYSEKVKALNLEIDRYNAILDGVKLQVEVDSVKIDNYKAEVQAYAEKIKGISLQYDAYETAMSGAKVQSDIHAVNTQAYSTRVDAFSTKNQVELSNAENAIKVNQYKLEEYNSDIQAYLAQLESELKHLQAASSQFDSENASYIAGIESQKVNVQAQTEMYNGNISLASQTTQANIANAQSNAQSAIAAAQIVQKGLESIADVNASYAGSSLSAANISMSISDSASNSASA